MPDLPMPAPHNTTGVMDVTPGSGSSSPYVTEPVPDPQSRPPRRRFAISFAIFATIAIALLAVAVLAYRWNRSTPHTSMIIVWADEKKDDWHGATAIVTGPNLKGGDLIATISKRDNLLVRFHVPPGRYKVTIIKDGKVIQQATHPGIGQKIVWWPFHAPEEAKRLNRT